MVKLNHFCSALVKETSSKDSEKIVERKSLAPKIEAKKAVSAYNDADETTRPPISAGKANLVLKISSKFTLQTLERPSRTVLLYFSNNQDN